MRTVMADARNSAVAARVKRGRMPTTIKSSYTPNCRIVKSYQLALRRGMILTSDVPKHLQSYL